MSKNMIEIVLDSHQDDIFLNQSRPVYTVDAINCHTLTDYLAEATKFIKQYADTIIVIVKTPQNFSRNMFALALFIESCHIDNKIDCVVFKVSNYEKALEEYKPFVALTIAVKYIMRLCKEAPKMIYKEFTSLGYLGLDIRQDYLNQKIILKLGHSDVPKKIITHSTADALAAVGMLKALSLANVNVSIELEVNETTETEPLNEMAIIHKLVDDIHPWIH